MPSVLTRFAPSPTGYLHVGNVRTALVCWLFARSEGGEFMLRLDDTDSERSREEYVDSIREDLEWLGLSWDRTMRQSERMERYREVKDQLVKSGRIYPCYETAEELEIKRKIQLGRGIPPIYDRAALALSSEQRAQFEAQGRQPHWRFKLDHEKTIRWNDLIKGELSFEPKHLSDPVIFRENGLPTYLLPSAVDDMDSGVTHIVRGEDHVTNTAVHVQMFEAMGAVMPQFAHLALIKSKEGKISKREGGFDIRSLREGGIEAMTINSFLARIGTSRSIEPCVTLAELVKDFNFSIFSRSAATYDLSELELLNPKLLQLLSFADVKEWLGIAEIDEAFWLAVRGNIQRLAEVKEWWRICKEPITPIIEDAELLSIAVELLPSSPWDSTTWSKWIEAIKGKTDRKGKALFMPLRKALTASEHGPELAVMLPLIGYDEVKRRLS